MILINNENIQLRYTSNYDRYMGNGLGGKTIYHLILKYNASEILKNLGEPNPLIEYNYYDVYSPKLKIRIECGHTNPSQFLSSINSEDIKKFWILQYPNTWKHTWDKHITNDPAILYKFQVKDICKNILYIVEQRSRAHARASIEKMIQQKVDK
jgi:hypothetical protein